MQRFHVKKVSVKIVIVYCEITWSTSSTEIAVIVVGVLEEVARVILTDDKAHDCIFLFVVRKTAKIEKFISLARHLKHR